MIIEFETTHNDKKCPVCGNPAKIHETPQDGYVMKCGKYGRHENKKIQVEAPTVDSLFRQWSRICADYKANKENRRILKLIEHAVEKGAYINLKCDGHNLCGFTDITLSFCVANPALDLLNEED